MKKKCYIIIMLLICSCQSTKKLNTSKEEKRIDTIMVFANRTIDKPIIHTIRVKDPCSQAGVLRPFDRQITGNHSKMSITSKDGILTAKINIDSVVSSEIKQYRAIDHTKVSSEKQEIIRYRAPLWAFIAMAYALVITVVAVRLFYR